MIRVTQAQAGHFILQKNHLAGEKATEITRLVADLGGLPSPTAATPFLSAYARFDQFAPELLLQALYQNRRLIKNELMRHTSYIVPAEDYALLHQATWRQRKQSLNAEFRLWDIENSEVEQLGGKIVELIGNQPATTEAIFEQLPQDAVRELTQTSRGGRVSTTTNVAVALRWLTATGELCASQATPTDTTDWRIEKLSYAPLNYWYPDIDFSTAPDEAEAQAAVVRAYLAAFGPATEADISFWTGFGKSETARATAALSPETTLTMVEGIPGMLLSLKSQAEALKATESPTEPIISVLPADDPFTTAHRASRTRYLADQKLQRQVFSSSGAAKPTILVNGEIAGVWTWASDDEVKDNVSWRLLAEIEPELVPLIQAELKAVANFIQPGMPVEQLSD